MVAVKILRTSGVIEGSIALGLIAPAVARRFPCFLGLAAD